MHCFTIILENCFTQTGIDAPRRDQNGHPLPSARRVSLLLFEDKNKPSHVHNTLYVTFGQFLDHDMTRTAVTKLSMEPLGKLKCNTLYHRCCVMEL